MKRLFSLALAVVVFAAALLCVDQALAAETGPAWASLSAAQREALAPLQTTWAATDAQRKRKWLQVATSFGRMPEDERQRVHERMSHWAALSPVQRANARIQFQETRQMGPEERKARWTAYQALPEAERTRLAQMDKSVTPVANRTSRPGEALKPKRNVVAAAPATSVKTVAPTVVQAKPGVTTTTMDQRSASPAHHQPGLPKITATPTFVDPNTLLPRRGAQAAAMRAANTKEGPAAGAAKAAPQ